MAASPARSPSIARPGPALGSWLVAPDPALRDRVESISFSADGATPPAEAIRVVPDGTIDLVVTIGADARAEVFGVKTRPLLVADPRPVSKLAVRFRPGRARRLLGVPADALRDASAALEQISPDAAARLLDPISKSDDLAACAAHVQRTLATRPGPEGANPVAGFVDAAVHRIVVAQGNVRLTQLCDDLGVGARRLERHFQREVGVAPKRFARIVRFQAALRALETGQTGSRAAADLGYADEAHLLRDFRSFAGVPPSALLPRRSGATAASVPGSRAGRAVAFVQSAPPTTH